MKYHNFFLLLTDNPYRDMNKLARYIIIGAVCVIVGFLAWYFRTVLIYIVVAAVVALIGRPITNWLKKFHIKKFKMPSALAAVLTLIIILTVFFSLFFLLSPIIGQIVHEFNTIDINTIGTQISGPLSDINRFIIKVFPSLDDSFKIEMYALSKIKDSLSFSTLSDIISTVTSVIADFGVALFSIVFISFFFLLEEGTFTNMIVAVIPDKYEQNIRRASTSISSLLSRYFVGISVESIGITLLNTIGLVFIAKMNFSLAIVVAFLSGLFNVIPYVGPLVGDVIGVSMGFISHYSSAFGGSIWMYVLVILIVMVVTQLIDNYIFQPLIYSSSVKAHPLEIFIVILMAGHIGGVVGMLVAIPAYTVLRVIASEFLSRFKIVQSLTKNIKQPDTPDDGDAA